MVRILFRYPSLTAAVASILISLVTALLAPLPAPQFHDEFSYLLASDTFAHGRLTNPSHPHWEFFETFHELSQPTYASKYPPAQGLMMALGQRATGEPIVGVWLSTAAACAAVAWMMQAVMSRRWATIGGLIAAAHPLVLDWNWSYWGGSVALLGGALLIGATLRLRRRASIAASTVAGLGIAILLNSRPLEGMILAALCIGWLTLIGRVAKIVVPLAAVLALNFAWMGYYNWRVTGNALLPPYMLYERQYAPTRPLTWLPPPTTTPSYRIPVMRDFYLNWELPNYQAKRTPSGFLRVVRGDLWTIARKYLRAPTLLLALTAIPFAWRRRWLRGIVLVVIVCVLNALPVLTFYPHYTAPVAGAFFLLLVTCLRFSHRCVIVAVIVGQIVGLGVWTYHRIHTDTQQWNFLRQQLVSELSQSGQQYLIFYQRPKGLDRHIEWVWNDADIDASPVVWARDLGDEKNQELIRYYPHRKAIRWP